MFFFTEVRKTTTDVVRTESSFHQVRVKNYREITGKKQQLYLNTPGNQKDFFLDPWQASQCRTSYY